MIRSAAIFCAGLLALTGAVSFSSARSILAVNEAAVMQGMARNLSDYRFFADARAQVPVPHVHRYRLNTPLYSDGADKLRFVYRASGTYFAGPDPDKDDGGLLQFPVGSALIKTFAFGEGDERRLIETRVLLHREDGWVALPYRWNEEQTDAKLALAGGRVPITTPAGEDISYRIPNKNQCKQCHVKDGSVTPIGPKARNLPAEWLAQMSAAGHFGAGHSAGNVTPSEYLPDWSARVEGENTAKLARAYLDINCAHCHQPGASASNSGLDLRWEQDDPHALGIAKPPVAAGRGSGGHLVSIAPGQPDQSIVVHRMSSTDPGVAMPELGKATLDQDGIAVVSSWITAMSKEGTVQ